MKACCNHLSDVVPGTTRRNFLKLAALGGSASLLASFVPSTAQAAGGTDALLLSCMDYRLVDETERYMTGRGPRDKYDHVILAGAALGAITDKFPAWNQTFWQHLDVAIKLHNVHTVMVMDHRDCGAYKVVLGEDFGKDPARETAAHTVQLQSLRRMIVDKYPKMKVELLLMGLDGKVEVVA